MSDAGSFTVSPPVAACRWHSCCRAQTSSGRSSRARGSSCTAPADGGVTARIAALESNPCSLAVDETNVYWVTARAATAACPPDAMTSATGSVHQAPLAGGDTMTLATAQPWPAGISVGGSQLYWANGGTYDSHGNYNEDGAVVSVEVGGKTVTTLFSGQANPLVTRVDSSNLYWINGHLQSPGRLQQRWRRASGRARLPDGDDTGSWPTPPRGAGDRHHQRLLGEHRRVRFDGQCRGIPGSIEMIPIGVEARQRSPRRRTIPWVSQ